MNNSTTRIRDWESWNHLKHYAALYGNFYVRTQVIDSAEYIFPAYEYQRIANEVLEPIRAVSSNVYIYGINADSDIFKSIKAPSTAAKGKIILGNCSMTDWVPLLGRADDESYDRGTLVFELDTIDNLWESVFRNCWNPVVMSGLSSVLTPSALQFAKRKCGDNKYFVLVSETGSGMGELFFIANKNILTTLAEIAAQHCKFTDVYFRNYGPKAKLASLEHKRSFGGFAE